MSSLVIIDGEEFVTGTWSNSVTGSRSMGLGSNGHAGLQFTATVTGYVSRVRIKTAASTTTFNARARLYSNNSGSPGTQIGSDSAQVFINGAPTEFTFSFTTPPAIVSGTTYWLVIVDLTTGNVTLDTVDAVGGYGSGDNATITSITDEFGEWRMEIVQLR